MNTSDIVKIPLSKGGHTIIDSEYAHLVANRKFHKDSLGYARGYLNGQRIRLHVIIMGKKEGYEVDHINRDKLDNRRSNLRFVTHSENNTNRKGWGKSGVKNVQYKPHESKKRPYVVIIKRDGIRHDVGRFSTLDEATEAVRMFNLAI